MKLTSIEEFVKGLLDNYAQQNPEWLPVYQKPNKSIEECCKFVQKEIYDMAKEQIKSQRNSHSSFAGIGGDDKELLGLCIHYYDEDDIVVEPMPKGVEAAAASAPAQDPKPAKPSAKRSAPVQPNLFDLELDEDEAQD